MWSSISWQSSAGTHYPCPMLMTALVGEAFTTVTLRCASPCQAHMHPCIQSSKLPSKVTLSPFYRWETGLKSQSSDSNAGSLLQGSLASHWCPEEPWMWWRESFEVRQAVSSASHLCVLVSLFEKYLFYKVVVKNCCGINAKWPEQLRTESKHSVPVPVTLLSLCCQSAVCSLSLVH